MANCPNCGTQVGEGAVFCDQCGTRIPAPEEAAPEAAPAPAGGSVICGACGAGNVPGEAFCDFCGSPMEPPVPTTETVPELEPVSTEAELEVTPAPADAADDTAAVEETAVAEETAPAAEAAAAPVEEPAAAEAEAKPVCPACNAEVLPGEVFCASCGASLAQPPIPPEPVAEADPAVEEAIEAVVEAVVPEPSPPEPAVPEVAPPAEPVAVPEPVVEALVPAPPASVPPAAPGCPVCGAELEPGDKFCSNCGAAVAVPTPVEVEAAPPPPPPPAGPRLVVVASGAEIPLPSASEILIGRQDPVSGIFPEVDLTPHGGEDGGVSRRHSRILVDAGSYFIEDLDSTNYTFVNKQRLAPKTRQPLQSGDEIRCGRVALILKT